mmetsp:Transcript_47746/g.87787  ORF Transcript_47746/g.87787 Transcript_47746/m.87787 type:complete len:672 (-) Transcript_47746:19-2034(-)
MPAGATKSKTSKSELELGPKLRTFVVNLKRREDRRRHIEDVCDQLGVKPEVIEAVDGRALARSSGAHYEYLGPATGRTTHVYSCDDAAPSRKRSQQPAARPVGFKGLENNVYRLTYTDKDGKQKRHLLRMAAHRLIQTEHTAAGHELWGALGCSLSHQKIMRKILAENLEFALILEDDASLPADVESIKAAFRAGVAFIKEERKDWNLIYLGGHISTSIKSAERTQWRISRELLQCKCIYQTHAYIIHRRIIPGILERMQQGMAADAALASWSRDRISLEGRMEGDVLMYSPPLLCQPGGPVRFKDSDIFVEGEAFKVKKTKDDSYAFLGAFHGQNKLWKSYLEGEEVLADDPPEEDVADAITDPYMEVGLDEFEDEEMDEAWTSTLLGELEQDLGEFAEEAKQIVEMKEAALRAARAQVGPGWLDSVAMAAYWLVHDAPKVIDKNTMLERERLAQLVSCELRIQVPHEQALIQATIPALVKLPSRRTRFDSSTCWCILRKLGDVLGKEIKVGSPELGTRKQANCILEIDGVIRDHTEHLEAVSSPQKFCTPSGEESDGATADTGVGGVPDKKPAKNASTRKPAAAAGSKAKDGKEASAPPPRPRKRKLSKPAGKKQRAAQQEEEEEQQQQQRPQARPPCPQDVAPRPVWGTVHTEPLCLWPCLLPYLPDK